VLLLSLLLLLAAPTSGPTDPWSSPTSPSVAAVVSTPSIAS
jgi:hypothetical protein